jgi:DNA-directed RNA polymerase I subunit RPA43
MAPSSPHPPSKRKHKTGDTKNAQPSKKLKKTEAVKSNDKGKGRDREFQLVTSSMVVSVPPVFAGNPRAGVEEMLDSLIMRYIFWLFCDASRS